MTKMTEMTDAEILKSVIDALKVGSVSAFSEQIGYANPSGVLHILHGQKGRNIGDKLILRITKAYPEVNELYLRRRSDQILIEVPILKKDDNSYSFNDLPRLFASLIEEQKKTNALLEQLVKK